MIDKLKFIQAFTTTLIHLPIIFWQAFLMDSVIWKFAFVVIAFFTFVTAYTSETINKKPMLVYLAVPLFLILFFILQIAKVEEFSVFIQLMASFGYLFWYKMSDTKEQKQMIEVWCADNYDYIKGEKFEHFHKSFESFDEAIEYIKSKLDEELKEIAKDTKNVETLKESYRFGGTDYFIKGSLGFSSWEYVEQNASRILDAMVGKALNDVMFEKEKIDFEFIPSSNNPYGFTIKPPIEGYTPYKEEILQGSAYLLVSFENDEASRDLNYLFDKERNHISWQKRQEECKSYLKTKKYDGGVVIEQRVSIKLHEHKSGYERWEYKVFENGKLFFTSESVKEIDFDENYQSYLQHKKQQKQREEYRQSIVDELLSYEDEEKRKEHIARLIIASMDQYIFGGGFREAGKLETIAYEEFASKLRELESWKIDEYYIHGLTIMALYMNDGECYEDVDVATFVQTEADKHGKIDAYERYFDKETELGELRGLGLC